MYGRPPRGKGFLTLMTGLFMPLALMKSADRIPDRSTRFLSGTH
ncbi:hypothetical protein X770_30775 [Mesorhizobium sp. LSJC269B00]|nr:hypothetical protein X770_30775 [Mesorhizobium sp. LSJC269B00]